MWGYDTLAKTMRETSGINVSSNGDTLVDGGLWYTKGNGLIFRRRYFT